MKYYKRTREARKAVGNGSGSCSGDRRTKSGRLADRAPTDYAEGSDDDDSSSSSESDQFGVEARGEIESEHESGNGQEFEGSDEEHVHSRMYHKHSSQDREVDDTWGILESMRLMCQIL